MVIGRNGSNAAPRAGEAVGLAARRGFRRPSLTLVLVGADAKRERSQSDRESRGGFWTAGSGVEIRLLVPSDARSSRTMVGPTGVWANAQSGRVIRGFAESRGALANSRFTSDPFVAGVTDRPTHNLLLMSGQRHKLLRSMVIPSFLPAAVGPLTPKLRDVRDHCVRRLLATCCGDLIADFVEPLARAGALESVGVPEVAQSTITPMLQSLVGSLEPYSDHVLPGSSVVSSLRIARVLATCAREHPPVGLQARLIEALKRDGISEADVTFTAPVVLHGGYENPLNFLSSLVGLAAEDPTRFSASARRWPGGVVEETLRLRPAARRVLRWDTGSKDGSAPSEMVWIDLESANRNPEVVRSAKPNYAAPPKHLTFGYGPHRCPGLYLARLLGRLVVEGLLELPAAALRNAVLQRRDATIACGIRSAHTSWQRDG